MESIHTRVRERIRSFFLLINYFLWFILSPSKFKKIDKKEIKNVIIISFGAIGELLVLTPFLPALKKSLNCEISVMISNESRNVFKNNPYVSEVLIYDKSFKKNIKELKKRKFDLAIIAFPGSFKYSLMCFLAKIKYQIGWGNDFRHGPPLFFNKNLLQLKKQHVVKENLNIIRKIGIINKNPQIEYYISEKEKASAKEKLKKLKVRKYVIIHPGFGKINSSKYPTRLWPLERYASLIDYISEIYGYKVILTGTKDEKEISEKIKQNVKNKKSAIIAAGKFNLEEFAYIISKSELLISPGTSAVHFASAFNTKIIELIGKEHYYRWHPWASKENYVVLSKDNVCRGCNEMECRKKTTECLTSINVEEVKNVIKKLLG